MLFESENTEFKAKLSDEFIKKLLPLPIQMVA